ncbi:MAG: amino acid--tRNA ligase-related protein [Clostridia bacterium]|nr:amino acid--tRNA ligase-related protein [Clostridia bacterium]
MNEYRTHKCNELTLKNVGEKVKIAGWIQTVRDLGGLLFLTIRDQYGIIQAVIDGQSNMVDELSKIPVESTISVTGVLRKRSAINSNMETGEIEILIESYIILGKRTKNLPFEINDDKEVREDLRLQYRFLDLRNEKIKNNILLRSKIIQYLRNQMSNKGFTEVQTPILTSSSPEGARDYLVPSRVHPRKILCTSTSTTTI